VKKRKNKKMVFIFFLRQIATTKETMRQNKPLQNKVKFALVCHCVAFLILFHKRIQQTARKTAKGV